MFYPDSETGQAYIEKICPEEEDQIYIDVLALESKDCYVEDVILDFYANENNLESPILELFLKSPYYVEWHTDSEGKEFRIVVIDNRHIASLAKSLSWFDN